MGIEGRRYPPHKEDRERPATAKGKHTDVITEDTYVVKPDAVADAIVRRLYAGQHKDSN